jgi:ribosomal protein S18 acetylase RimI-like enzyme
MKKQPSSDQAPSGPENADGKSKNLEELVKKFSTPNSRRYREIQFPAEECSLVIRPALPEDQDQLLEFIAQLQVTFSRLRGKVQSLDLIAAEKELAGYQAAKFRIYVALCSDDALTGYLVCRIEDDVVWAESLFVQPDYRRQGIASALYEEAERLAEEMGGDMVYNRVHPNNERTIAFLRKRGYTVLNGRARS